MRKSALLAFAAGTLCVASTAAAQPGPYPDGPVRPGHSWRGPGPQHPGGATFHRRLQRGFVVHPTFMGPQFHVTNWGHYGFAQPPQGHRWIRHYDDAYMVGPRGEVVDGHYGLDWDQYGERWEMSEGIPHYYGSGDFHPRPDDYAAADAHARAGGWDYREYRHAEGDGGRRHHGGGHDGRREHHGDGGEDHGAYDYREGYRGGYEAREHRETGYGHSGYAAPGSHVSYGYGYGYPVIIVETTVTTGGMVVEEVVEEVVETRQRARRVQRPRRARCDCPAQAAPRRAAPRRAPPPGERG